MCYQYIQQDFGVPAKVGIQQNTKFLATEYLNCMGKVSVDKDTLMTLAIVGTRRFGNLLASRLAMGHSRIVSFERFE